MNINYLQGPNLPLWVNKNTWRLTFLVAVASFLQSCSPAMNLLFGIERIESFDQEEYQSSLEKLVGQYSGALSSFFVSKESFINYSNIDTGQSKNLRQPIQMLYFKDGELQSFQANCFAKGNIFGQLNWTYNGRFNSYFPISAIPTASMNMPLEDVSRELNIDLNVNGDVVLFFWTRMLDKASFHAFKTLIENIESTSLKEEPQLILINSDHAFIDI